MSLIEFVQKFRTIAQDPDIALRETSWGAFVYGDGGLVDALVRREDGSFRYYSDVLSDFDPSAPVADIVVAEGSLETILEALSQFF